MTDDEAPRTIISACCRQRSSADAEHQKQGAADYARDQAAASLATLVANLLRVLAGAGQSYALPGNLLKASEYFRDAYNAGNRNQMPALEELTLYHLFREGEESDKPQTEEEWRRWAADDPRRDYEEGTPFTLASATPPYLA